MNKKYIIAMFSLTFVVAIQPLVAMNAVFRGVQIVTSGAVMGCGVKIAYGNTEKIKKPVIGENKKPIMGEEASEPVKKFVHERLAQLNFPNHSEVPVIVADIEPSWFFINDKGIGINRETAAAIESGDMKVLQQGDALGSHEVKHLLSKDLQKRAYAWAIAPCAVQTVSSGLSYGFNKVFKRQHPKTLFSLTGRSFVAGSAMVPKGLLSIFGVMAYTRYQEAEADRFACEHASSRAELESFKSFFDEIEEKNFQAMMKRPSFANAGKKSRNIRMRLAQFDEDPEHPFPADRSAMIQRDIDKWDTEHKS